MKTLYLDCFAGISGDMTVGALLDAGITLADLERELAKVPLKGYSLSAEKVTKGGLAGTKFTVNAEDNHPHRHLSDIFALIEGSNLAAPVKEKAKMMFRKLALAEGKIHGQPPEKIHFHEVGAVDSLVDILAVLIGLDLLGINQIICSPLPLARGWIKCQHGLIPAPAPATLELLKGLPTTVSTLDEETVTPTGALIASCLADSFGPPPSFLLEGIGYGAGSKNLPIPNLLRVLIGSQKPTGRAEISPLESAPYETIWVLETNIDDMNPEFYPYIIEKALEKGALDAFLTPVIMKKGRPGFLFTLLAPDQALSSLQELIFVETSTLGIRMRQESRSILSRDFVTVDTLYGPLRVKYSLHPATRQVLTIAPEYEDCRKLAAAQEIPIKLVYQEGQRLAWQILADASNR